MVGPCATVWMVDGKGTYKNTPCLFGGRNFNRTPLQIHSLVVKLTQSVGSIQVEPQGQIRSR